mmetsp:Transcript_18583/g.40215  ORF Transcript_18583/g.40215 Transcript_18583/m.40215 type:complete len:285 (+) Transcript_18583:1460-2314(+)
MPRSFGIVPLLRITRYPFRNGNVLIALTLWRSFWRLGWGYPSLAPFFDTGTTSRVCHRSLALDLLHDLDILFFVVRIIQTNHRILLRIVRCHLLQTSFESMKKWQVRMRAALLLVRLWHILLQPLERLSSNWPQHFSQPLGTSILLFESLDMAHDLLQIIANTARSPMLTQPFAQPPTFILAHSPQKSILDIIASLRHGGLGIPHQRLQLRLCRAQVIPRHDALVVPFESFREGGHVARQKLSGGHSPAAVPRTTVGSRIAGALRQCQPLPQFLLAIDQEVDTR